MNDSVLGFTQEQLRTAAARWTEQFPDLHAVAREQAAKILARHSNQVLDPDQVWWHRFDDTAVSSPRTYTGWEHDGVPSESMTFVQLLMHRFAAQDQDGLDNLQVEGGFYTDGPGHGRYDEHNEVRLLAADVAADFWQLDFASLYRTTLERFWREQQDTFLALARTTYLGAVADARARKQLSAEDLRMLRGLLGSANNLRVCPWVLNGRTARDVLRLVNPQGRQILYLPGDHTPLRIFASADALYQWLRQCASRPDSRAELARHFSSFNPADSLESLLDTLRDDTTGGQRHLVGWDAPAIDGDPFTYLGGIAHQEMQAQADRLLTSNEHLREQLWVGYLGTFISLGGALAPLAWPVALMVVGAGIGSLVLNVKKALQTTTAGERRAAITGAVLASVVIVFNAPFLFEAGRAGVALADQWQPLEAWEAGVEGVQEIPLIEQLPTHEWPAGARLNGLGQLERSDLPLLYVVQKLPRGTDPAQVLNQGLRATVRFDLARPMLESPVLRTFGSAQGAVAFAKAEFDGPFALYEIDADGLRAASLRENLRHNSRATLHREDLPVDFLQQYAREGRSLDEAVNGAWRYDEVHLSLAELDTSRVHLVGAEQVARLSGTREPLTGVLGEGGLLRGVTVHAPAGGRLYTTYSINVQGQPVAVRLDPLTGTWRSGHSQAYRLTSSGEAFEALADASRLPPLGNAMVDQALAQLGIDARLPWEVKPLVAEGALPIPRRLHSVWIGRHMPRKFINRVLLNAERAAQGAQPFETHLYLSIDDVNELDRTLERLAQRPASLQVHLLEQTPFFATFRQSRYYAQYRAASQGPGHNYASAVDVLRYRLLHHEGGLYLDVDDSLVLPQSGDLLFGDHAFTVKPGELLLGSVVFHRRLNMLSDFNTSHFASLPDNPLLDHISEASYRAFLAQPDLYRIRPFDFLNTEAEMTHYGRTISRVTGPGVFNAEIDRWLPDYRQFRALHRVTRGELYLAPERLAQMRNLLAQRNSEYSALSGLIRIGATGSWLHT